MCRCLHVISPGSAEEMISEQCEALPEQLQQQIFGDVEQQEATLAEDSEQQQQEATLAEDSEQQQQEATLASQRPSVKAFARRKFMSNVIHGSCQHSFLVGCNLTSEAYLLQSGVVELLLYCSMHACINCSTVCVSMKRVQSKDSDSSQTTLFSCSFGCTAYAQSYCLFPLSCFNLCRQVHFRP
jgi:hypothetical protein